MKMRILTINRYNLIMSAFSIFVDELHIVLQHINKPDYKPSTVLLNTLDRSPLEDIGSVRSMIVDAIERLKPLDNIPIESFYWDLHEILQSRFILGLTLEQTAERLHVSVRNLQRMQKAAITVLAQELWNRAKGERLGQEDTYQAIDWKTQSEIELESLLSSSPYENSNISETVNSALELKAVLFTLHGVEISVGYLQEDLLADIHPSILKQILISTLNHLSKIYKNCRIEIYALLEDGVVVISINGTIALGRPINSQDILSELFIPHDVQVAFSENEGNFSLQIKIKPIGQRVVMVIEDNPDLIQFFKRATVGTPYHIIHISQPHKIFDLIADVKPNIIVLDVMLPEIDGWQMLTHLHLNPLTRPIPKIVCSVVKEGDLAIALGASMFLAKPITHKQFLDALDRVFIQEAPK